MTWFRCCYEVTDATKNGWMGGRRTWFPHKAFYYVRNVYRAHEEFNDIRTLYEGSWTEMKFVRNFERRRLNVATVCPTAIRYCNLHMYKRIWHYLFCALLLKAFTVTIICTWNVTTASVLSAEKFCPFLCEWHIKNLSLVPSCSASSLLSFRTCVLVAASSCSSLRRVLFGSASTLLSRFCRNWYSRWSSRCSFSRHEYNVSW